MLLVFGVLVMAIFFTSGDANDVSQGPGDNVSIIKYKSTGLHLIEVDNTGSNCEGQGWSWVVIVCLVLAISFGLTVIHMLHYCWCTKQLVTKKVERLMANGELINLPRIDKSPGERVPDGLEIPALA